MRTLKGRPLHSLSCHSFSILRHKCKHCTPLRRCQGKTLPFTCHRSSVAHATEWMGECIAARQLTTQLCCNTKALHNAPVLQSYLIALNSTHLYFILLAWHTLWHYWRACLRERTLLHFNAQTVACNLCSYVCIKNMPSFFINECAYI